MYARYTHPSVSELYIVDFILHSRVKIDEGRFFIKYVGIQGGFSTKGWKMNCKVAKKQPLMIWLQGYCFQNTMH